MESHYYRSYSISFLLNLKSLKGNYIIKNIFKRLGIVVVASAVLVGCATATVNKPVYIPALSYSQAVLLNGLVLSESESAPVVMQITGETTMPEGTTNALNVCRVSGFARADIATERIYIRNLHNISCYKNDKPIELPVEGYVIGEDAKSGVKAKLSLTQGSIIEHANESNSNLKPKPFLVIDSNRHVTVLFTSGFTY